jgi:regulator of protease activity HflC (stomatin/prohibitin superfamily)
MSLLRSLVLVASLSSACVTIGPGRVGLLWRASDGTQKTTYPEGLHSVAPWNTMSVYDLRAMSHDEDLGIIAVNGLTIKLNTSVRYRIEPTEVVALQQEIGPEYYEKVLEPVLRSEARRVIGRYTPEEIYSTKRELIERELREGLREKIAGKHLLLEAILVRNVELPPAIRTAIDQKLSAEQDVLKMKFVLELAKAEAEKKRIESQGIADYNRTVSLSLGQPILDYERIQQLSHLAASPNAKMVVLGPGSTPPTLLLPGSGSAAK